MANNTGSRVAFNLQQRPLSTDWNRLQALAAKTLADTVAAMQRRSTFQSGVDESGASAAPLPGFFDDGFRVTPGNLAMTVRVTAGMGLQIGTAQENAQPPAGAPTGGVDDLSVYKYLTTDDQTFAVPTADPSQDRYDRIEVTQVLDWQNPEPTDIYSEVQKKFLPQTAFRTFNPWDLTLQGGTQTNPTQPSTAGVSYHVGLPGAGVPPSPTPGYLTLAIVKVAAGATTIGIGDILDSRQPAALGSRIILGGSAISKYNEPPTAITLNAPGGWRCCINHGIISGFRVYVFGPDLSDVVPENATVSLFGYDGGTVPYQRIDPSIQNITVSTVGALLKSQIAGSADFFPNLEVAKDTSVVYFDVIFWHWNTVSQQWDLGGTWGASPLQWNWNLSLALR